MTFNCARHRNQFWPKLVEIKFTFYARRADLSPGYRFTLATLALVSLWTESAALVSSFFQQARQAPFCRERNIPQCEMEN